MINIEYKKDNEQVELTVVGHAHSNEPGKDLVCCAVSTLVQTLGFYVHINATEKEYTVEDGYSYIRAADPKVRECFSLTAYGLKILANQYPNYINFVKKEVK